MVHMVEMLGSVLVLRRVATPYTSAHHAQAQMNPGIAKLYALFANMRLGRRNLDLIQMLTLARHDLSRQRSLPSRYLASTISSRFEIVSQQQQVSKPHQRLVVVQFGFVSAISAISALNESR
jgi:hypothetical protein